MREGVREIFDHFWYPEFLLACHYFANIEVGDTDIKIVAYLGKEGFGCCILIEHFELPHDAPTVHIDRQVFQHRQVVLSASEDKLRLLELFLQPLHLLLELLHALEQELVDVIEYDDNGFVPDLVDAVLVEGVPQHGNFVELVSEHVPVFDIEQVDEKVYFKYSALDQVSR